VYWYDFDSQYSNIKGDLKRSVRLEGYGPRHLALGEGELVYMTAELNQRVVVMGMGKGRLQVLAEVVTSQNVGTFLSEVKYFRKGVGGGGEFVAVASRGDNEMIIY
jgi:6-phosphogluconolactonase (cycloisomerase 2 family)